MKSKDHRKILSSIDPVIIVLVVVGSIGIILILISTPRGIGVGYDSLFYLSSAENFSHGLGLRWPSGTSEIVPLVHYPPLYPLLLALLSWPGVELVLAARLLACVLFGFNLFLIGFIIYRYTKLAFISLPVVLVAFTSPVLIDIHFEALSEPLFIICLLSSLLLILEYVKSGKRVLLVASAGVTSLACLTRYVGPSIIATGIVSLMLLGSGSVKRRSVDCVIFSGISLIPLSLWYTRNYFLTGSITSRNIVYHPLTYANRRLGIETVTEWVVSNNVRYEDKKIIFLSLGVGLIILFGLAVWNEIRKLDDKSIKPLMAAIRLPILLAVFVMMYCLVLIISLSFIDASTKLDDRILSPLYVVGIIFSFCLIGLFFGKRGRHPLFLSSFLVVIGALIWVNVERSIPIVITMREEGRGFTNQMWQASETITEVRELDLQGAIYSTEALPLYFLTGKTAYSVPERADSILDREIQNYNTKLDTMRRRLEGPSSALVIFSSSFNRVEMPPQSELVDGLVLMKQSKDGSIWIHPDSINQD